MMDYDNFHREVLGGTAGQAAPRWASGVLGEIARGGRNVAAMRHPLGFLCIPVDRTGDQGAVSYTHLTLPTTPYV